MAKKKVGELIKEARTKAGMTQADLAACIQELSASDISKAERGEKGHQACPFPEGKRRTALEQPHERADAPQEPRVGEACHESERQIPQNPAQKGLF